jgi:hypothetical protein
VKSNTLTTLLLVFGGYEVAAWLWNINQWKTVTAGATPASLLPLDLIGALIGYPGTQNNAGLLTGGGGGALTPYAAGGASGTY